MSTTFQLTIERCKHRWRRIVYLYCCTWKINTRNINAIKMLTLLKPKILVSYSKSCLFRRKAHSFGFCGLGKGLPERSGSHSGAFLDNPLQAWGDHHAGSSCSPNSQTATGPQIIQSLKHFLPSSSNSPASIKWLQQSCLLHKPFPDWNPGNSLWTLLYINTQFPWFPYNSIKCTCSVVGT